MAEKVTEMVLVLKVDLACSCCYKKVKKVLCKFPQIRDQVYDVKQNTVKITVVCCNPEKMRDKLCCKGRKVIKSIEIKKPESKMEKQVEKKKDPKDDKPNNSLILDLVKMPDKEDPSKRAHPGGVCCGPCYEGYGGGPCYDGYRRLVPPPPCSCYDGYWYEYGYRYGYGYGGNRSCCVSNYCSEENPQGCTIM